ncbi:trypsin-like peptidase domain-containing protein [Ideonella sp. DXS22W]|uniref:Trypsin-like peptidase domain-containing protein n=1 Tax=Pseudaquabacterium inlustre TaxID=2984192 RepID=A0ABU9CDN0_9BURK
MKARTPLYSRSPQRPVAGGDGAMPAATVPGAAPAAVPASAGPVRAAPVATVQRPVRWAWLRRHERWAWALGALLLAMAAGWPAWTQRLPLAGAAGDAARLKALDAALRESLTREPLPAATAAAHAAVLPSVVRVQGHGAPAEGRSPGRATRSPPSARPQAGTPPDEAEPSSVGTGVVIVDRGLILTALHVVDGAARITVTFSDGSDSPAVVVARQPENDLAVLQATVLPDDLHAATMRSTQGLAPGDAVLAVGFPFGIGPSASAGVVSGLQREFRAPGGGPLMRNLIQFDAAANPGNSGGPLVTMDGHVVGIVTAIMNPNQQRTFIGIAFAVPIENAAAAAGMPPF